MEGADTQGRDILEATVTHPRAVVAGVSPREVVGGVSPMEVGGDSPMVVEAGVKVVAPTTSGISPVSRKPT